MLQNSESLILITRHLNNTNDLDCKLLVDKFRSESSDNEKYFLEIERIWQLSSSAGILEGIDEKQSVHKIKLALGQHSTKNNSWWKGIAASLLVLALGYWIYNQTTKVNFLTKTTAQFQVDSVKLADGSVIILAENSELIYPDKFGSSREISLVKGQAFFKIAKDPKHPFKVLMNKSNVIVLGTSFNIKMTETKIDLGVITGKVFFTPYSNGTTAILTAGQALSYDVMKKEFLTETAQNSDSWLTKELIFVDTPLEDVCKQLTEYYGTEIKLESNNKNNKKLNAIFKDQNLDQVLEILNETYNIKINKENNQINLITP
ncbi:DUF4974 domain-containing protein [Pedobacter polaris]|uniref:DUF4974 domain-containing protein n=1 Tax=Pedobacter polaris TaxID=2571273 RepID=A0A4U1CSY7_9SPHI|nr:FecR domain-containing protein [Pedobacter polaris]TKC12241.1 DUF4974 domain-containing protein [Pedobacter polaris]